MHTYASSEGMYVGIKGTITGSFILLLWYGLIVKRYRICIPLLILEFIMQLTVLSKSAIIIFFLNGLIVYIYSNGLTSRQILRFVIIFIGLFIAASIFAAMTHSLRSAMILKHFDDISISNMSTDVSVKKALIRLLDRLNLHNPSPIFENENLAASMDLLALKGLYLRLILVNEDIRNGPGITRKFKGYVGLPSSKSALVFLRSVLLYHMGFGIIAIGIFNTFLGLFSGLLWGICYSIYRLNPYFLMIYIPFAWDNIAGYDSNIAAQLFHIIQLLIAVFIPLGAYLFVIISWRLFRSTKFYFEAI
jgi:hypothetical protein